MVELHGLHGPVGELALSQIVIDFEHLDIPVPGVMADSLERGIDVNLLPLKDLEKKLSTQDKDSSNVGGAVIQYRNFRNRIKFAFRQTLSRGTDVGNTFQTGLRG
jgi:hypothetical protein